MLALLRFENNLDDPDKTLLIAVSKISLNTQRTKNKGQVQSRTKVCMLLSHMRTPLR